jgi:hypothetical protein
MSLEGFFPARTPQCLRQSWSERGFIYGFRTRLLGQTEEVVPGRRSHFEPPTAQGFGPEA